MAESEVKILTVEAVKSMADLRKAISDTKEALNGMELGSEEYQRTLAELIKEQNLMRGAMNGTTASMDDLKAAADGTTVSYNGLVNSMANMKRELRNLDLSTAEGRARFKELSQEIKNTNDALKELDEKQGSYVRNVGNYTSGLKNLGEILKNNVPALGNTARAVGDVDKAVHLLGQQPILGIIGLLAPLIAKITDELKDNKTAMGAVKKLTKSFEPVLKVVHGVLQKIAEWAAEALSGVASFVKTALPQLKNFISGVVGVGNAIVQFLWFPIKQTIEAAKGLGNILRDIFTGQWVKIKEDAKNAVKGLNDAFTKGLDFKGNFEAGQKAGDAFIEGLASEKFKKKATKKGKDAIAEILKNIQISFDNEMDSMLKDIESKVNESINRTLEAEAKQLEFAKKREAASLAAIDKTAAHQLELNEILTENERDKATKSYEIQQLALERRLHALDEFRQAALDRGDIELLVQYEQDFADTQIEIETATLREKKRLREQDKKDAIDTLQFYAKATSGIASSIADILETEGKSAKNLRIAAATIDMISGAVTAFSTAQQLGPIAGPIVGAINAAAVVASGLANIAKIRATNVSKDAAPTSSAPAQATVSAPALETAVPTTTVINGARTETALNRAAQPQKVVLVQSEAEAMAEMTRVQVAEASF